VALTVLATRTCRSQTASSEVRFLVGDAGAGLERLEADLYRPDDEERLGFFQRNYPRGSGAEAGVWRLKADDGLYRMRIAVRSAGRTMRVERGVEIRDGAVITVDLERDLTAR
jgi:hypothetical protein